MRKKKLDKSTIVASHQREPDKRKKKEKPTPGRVKQNWKPMRK